MDAVTDRVATHRAVAGGETMWAARLDRYGGPEALSWTRVAAPALRPGTVQVQVQASAVCGDDWHIMRGVPYLARVAIGLRRPRHPVMGLDLAGRVVAVGAGVTRFAPGDAVFGCGPGAWAEQAVVAESRLAHRPANLSAEQAAVVPTSGLTALQALRDRGGVEPGQRVLINGASGGVGSFAVQLACWLGAEVTAVGGPRSQALLAELGAHHTLDHTTVDFTATGARYDVIVDLAQSHRLSACRRALTPRGTLVLAGSAAGRSLRGRAGWFKGTDRWLRALLLSPFIGQRLRPLVHAPNAADLEVLRGLLAAGRLVPVIDRVFALADAAEAVRYSTARAGHGKIALRLDARGTA